MATWKVTTREIDGTRVRGIVLPNVETEELDFAPSAALGAVSPTGEPKDAEVPTDRFVAFDKPGRRAEKKRLFTVMAHSPAGVLLQLPMEDQINNHTASPETGLGLQQYVRKGFVVYWDPTDGSTAWCATWGCNAEASKKFRGQFCTRAHMDVTLPSSDGESGFGAGATTSRTWGG